MSRLEAYEQLIKKFTAWAETEADIRMAFILGSRARTTDHPADEWSDLDVLMVVTDPARYLSTAAWIDHMGTPWLTFLEPTADGRSMERRVLYEGGLDVDFALFPVAIIQHMAQHGLPPDAADTLRRGMRLLIDKEGLVAHLTVTDSSAAASPLPTYYDFDQAVHDFWYHAVWTAKHLRRGELWWAKSGCDGALKRLLLKMLEWQARAKRGQGYDTWLRGRFLEEWADPRAVAALPQVFAHYDEADIWRALLATMALFRWLSVETAQQLDYAYPVLGADKATELVQTLLAEKG